MNKKGIIFDCDGTLVDSLGDALASFNYALEKLGEPLRTIEEIKRHFGAGADRIFMKLLGHEEKALEAFHHYVDHQSQLALNMKLHSGVRELLDLLAAEKIPMGIVTGRHAKDLEAVIAPHKLHSYFAAIISDNMLPHSKPAPDGILMAAKLMGVSVENTFYVGDSASDITAAQNAGSIGVAALWDVLATRESFQSVKPAYFAEKSADVWTHFQKHWK